MKYLVLICLLALSGCYWETHKKIGTVEKYSSFAWVPERCRDGNTYWFDTVVYERVWVETGIYLAISVEPSDTCLGRAK